MTTSSSSIKAEQYVKKMKAEKLTENTYSCNAKIWKKFSEAQRKVYNRIRSYQQSLVVHPKTKLTDEEWSTISHNMACLGAWASGEELVCIKEQKARK